MSLKVIDVSTGELLGSLKSEGIDAGQLKGNIALLSHFPSQEEQPNTPSVRFSDWRISGSKVNYDPGQSFGPICFAQYTLDRGVMKMTAQLAPVEMIGGHKVELQLRADGHWETVETTTIHRLARTAHFRIEDWRHEEDIPYRIQLELPLKSGDKEDFYEEPLPGAGLCRSAQVGGLQLQQPLRIPQQRGCPECGKAPPGYGDVSGRSDL
ncbi:MAG: hypothetical protein U5K69_23180 [Balneolaceae bacterium]|nr:hypothetical protein [Balneolaceae bacterium]